VDVLGVFFRGIRQGTRHVLGEGLGFDFSSFLPGSHLTYDSLLDSVCLVLYAISVLMKTGNIQATN